MKLYHLAAAVLRKDCNPRVRTYSVFRSVRGVHSNLDGRNGRNGASCMVLGMRGKLLKEGRPGNRMYRPEASEPRASCDESAVCSGRWRIWVGPRRVPCREGPPCAEFRLVWRTSSECCVFA